jgi:hypothetical protein
MRGHREDCRTQVTDAEIITIALTAMLDFGGNFDRSRLVLFELGLVKRLLSRWRFSRRVNFNGFLLKIALFLFANQVNKAFVL